MLPLSYQWRKNGTNIAGATNAIYVTPPTTLADNGARFSVVVGNSAGSVTRQDARLRVKSKSAIEKSAGTTEAWAVLERRQSR